MCGGFANNFFLSLFQGDHAVLSEVYLDHKPALPIAKYLGKSLFSL